MVIDYFNYRNLKRLLNEALASFLFICESKYIRYHWAIEKLPTKEVKEMRSEDCHGI